MNSVASQGAEATYAVGGGESGWIAVDPRDHNIVYAGNYGGTVARIDRKFGIGEEVSPYADMQTGQQAADMKFSFQWNAPIKISLHAPDAVFTTSQYVHKSTNGGLDWTVVSPDLTRNDKRRQGYSGGEGITRDNTGGTLDPFYLMRGVNVQKAAQISAKQKVIERLVAYSLSVLPRKISSLFHAVCT